MGKSAMIEEFLNAHPDATVLGRLQCDQFEQQLPFAGAGLLLGCWLTKTSEVQVGRELLSWFSEAQVNDGPVVVVIDDAQWLDQTSAQAIRFALRRLRADRVLVVVARRPPEGTDFWHGLGDLSRPLTTIRLGPFRADTVRSLVSATRGWALPLSSAVEVVDRTGGVPLLVAAVVRDAPTVEALTSGKLPGSAATAARHMLASLGDPARRLVEAAAVLAEPTALSVLGTVADVTDPASAAGSAQAAGLLSTDAAGRLNSSHALLREAVYELVPLDRRRLLHRRAVEWTGGDRRLSHRVAAADHLDPQLLADLVEAVTAAVRSGRRQLAATHRLQAREFTTDPRQRDELLLEALIDTVEVQQVDDAKALASEAQQVAAGPLRSLALGLLARETGHVAEARSLLHQAIDEASDGADEALAARAGRAAASLHIAMTQGPEAMAAAAAAVTARDPAVAGDAITFYGLGQWQSGDLAGALATLDAIPVSPNGTPWEVDLLASRGMVRYYAGRLDGALADLDQAISLTHLWRPGSDRVRAHVQRSLTRYNIGDWDGATIDAAAARAVADGLTQPWSLPLADAVSAQVPANRGQWDLVEEHLSRARAGIAGTPAIMVTAVIAAVEMLAATARKDWAAVRAVLDPLRTGDNLRRLGQLRSFRWVAIGWTTAAIELGELAEADTALDNYTDMLRQWPEGPIPTRLGSLRGRLAEARGDAAAAQRHYRTDLSDTQVQAQPFIHAQVLQAAGNLERVLGNRRDAIDHLLHAQQIFTRLRATPYLDRCAADLAGCGLRSSTTDPLSLTEREEDVTALVTRGLTNKEVADELFLTVKTIEYHLRNIYTKLGIGSRRELRQLRPATPTPTPRVP